MDPDLQEEVQVPQETPIIPQHNPQDIDTWVAAFGDCV